MEEKFVIECRYETWGTNGKEYVKWFVHDSSPVTKSIGEQKIKDAKEAFGYIDKRTKLKHEYRLVSYAEYLKQQNEQIEKNKEIAKKQAEYYKSSEYKELQKKKRQAAKELKEHQKAYNEAMLETMIEK